MKRMKIVAVLAAFLSVVSFSSCLDSDGDRYDFYDYVTLTWNNRVKDPKLKLWRPCETKLSKIIDHGILKHF